MSVKFWALLIGVALGLAVSRTVSKSDIKAALQMPNEIIQSRSSPQLSSMPTFPVVKTAMSDADFEALLAGLPSRRSVEQNSSTDLKKGIVEFAVMFAFLAGCLSKSWAAALKSALAVFFSVHIIAVAIGVHPNQLQGDWSLPDVLGKLIGIIVISFGVMITGAFGHKVRLLATAGRLRRQAAKEDAIARVAHFNTLARPQVATVSIAPAVTVEPRDADNEAVQMESIRSASLSTQPRRRRLFGQLNFNRAGNRIGLFMASVLAMSIMASCALTILQEYRLYEFCYFRYDKNKDRSPDKIGSSLFQVGSRRSSFPAMR
jgi:hypothetical protein